MISGLLRFLVGLGLALTAAGFLGSLHWSLDLCAHFRPHLAVGGLVVALAAALLRRPIEAGLALLAAAVDVAVVVPLYLGAPAVAADAPRFTVLLSNVNRVAGDPEALARILADSDADVVGLVEVDDRWMKALAPALKRWPHRLEQLQTDNFGVALCARTPLKAARVVSQGSLQVPTLVAQTTLAGRPIGLVLAHPPPPITGSIAAARDEVMGQIAALTGLPEDRVVFGDFNATPWSAPFRRLLTDGELALGRKGFGIQPTWPADLGFAGVPIDHILTRGRLVVVEHEVLSPIGSDHLPIRAVIAAPAAPTK